MTLIRKKNKSVTDLKGMFGKQARVVSIDEMRMLNVKEKSDPLDLQNQKDLGPDALFSDSMKKAGKK